MATLKQRLHRKNAAGTYDAIHLETSADLVLMTDGSTKLSDKIGAMDTAISGKAAASHTHTTISGNAGTATKLATARTIRTNLASTATASFDGSGNVTPGVTGTLGVGNGGTGVTSIQALKDALGITAASKPSTSITIGGSVSMGAFDWICVHTDSSYNYLMTKYVIGSTTFGQDTNYAGSQAALMALLFGTAIGVWGNSAFGNITVNGVPGYCFLPSYDQMNGGFSYFNSNDRRKATDPAGNAKVYWTSSPSGGSYVYCVNTDGNLNYNGPGTAYGFRPCVALKR